MGWWHFSFKKEGWCPIGSFLAFWGKTWLLEPRQWKRIRRYPCAGGVNCSTSWIEEVSRTTEGFVNPTTSPEKKIRVTLQHFLLPSSLSHRFHRHLFLVLPHVDRWFSQDGLSDSSIGRLSTGNGLGRQPMSLTGKALGRSLIWKRSNTIIIIISKIKHEAMPLGFLKYLWSSYAIVAYYSDTQSFFLSVNEAWNSTKESNNSETHWPGNLNHAT